MAKEKETKNKKEVKNKKSFFKDFKAELKKVIWPTPKQLINSTTAVVAIVLITALTVFALDFVFKAVNKYGINKLRASVKGQNTIQVEQVNLNEVQNSEIENSVVETENDVEENTVENNEIENEA